MHQQRERDSALRVTALGLVVLLGLTMLALGASQAVARAESESSEVLLDRKNTLGGWEIFARLRADDGEVALLLRVNDLGNVRAKVLKVDAVRFSTSQTEFEVACSAGVSVDRRLRGVGILGDDTSRHECPLSPEHVDVLGAGDLRTTSVVVAGTRRKARPWKPKKTARWAGFFAARP